MTSLLTNAAGEPERDRCSRRANLFEGLAFASLVLLVSWPFCFEFGVLRGNPLVQQAAVALLQLGALWALVISPFALHRDSAESLGYGNPHALFRRIRAGEWRLLATVAALIVALVVVGLLHWPLTARFARLPAAAMAWPQTMLGHVWMLAFCAAVAGTFAAAFIRYDNFWPALRRAFLATLPLALIAILLAYLHRGSAAFGALQRPRLWLDVVGYIFWGGLQQILFVAYFGTRIRKGFAPGGRARRLCVALLSASFFALIHLPSYRLVLVTLILGTIFAWLAMEDRYRNLAAFAVVHGVMGATIAKLYSTADAGVLRIGFRVGPWSRADELVTWIALGAVIAYVTVGLRALSRRTPTTRLS